MADYASRADLDALIQTLQSNPGEKGRPYFRGVPVVVQRDYSGAAIPAGAYNEWDRVWTFNGRGSLLYPDRQIDVRLLLSGSNFSGRDLFYRLRVTLNGNVVATQNGLVQNGDEAFPERSFRLIAMGSNTAQALTFNEFLALAEPLDEPWELAIDVGWADHDEITGMIETFLTQPVPDTYFARLHSLVILT